MRQNRRRHRKEVTQGAKFPTRPIAGAGLGLRSQHVSEILGRLPAIPWFEALSDNYMGSFGLERARLAAIREHYPVVLHGVGLSLGSADPLDWDYLKRLKGLADWIQPAWISDHLAWCSVDGLHAHDLLPVPRTEEAVAHVSARIRQVQDFLGQPILIENASSYLEWKASTLSEADFVNSILSASGCNLLLDVNNVYVSSVNLGFSAQDFLNAMPPDRVRQIHLAGYQNMGSHLLDTHGNRVYPEVWALYQRVIQAWGAIPTLIEWDTDIPDLDTLLAEAALAQKVLDHAAS